MNLSVYIFTVRLKFDQEIHMMGTAAYLVSVARELEQEYREDKICEELAPLLPPQERLNCCKFTREWLNAGEK